MSGEGPGAGLQPVRPHRAAKVIARKARILTPDDYSLLLAAIPDQYKLMVDTLIETGLRWGEFIALKPRHIDFLRRSITIEETIVEVSEATPLPASARQSLRHRHRHRHRSLGPRSASRPRFLAARRRSRPQVRHGARMGHSQIQTTKKYPHALPDSDQRILDALTRVQSRKFQGSSDAAAASQLAAFTPAAFVRPWSCGRPRRTQRYRCAVSRMHRWERPKRQHPPGW